MKAKDVGAPKNLNSLKGKSLEELAAYLLKMSGDLFVVKQNIRTTTNEIDQIFIPTQRAKTLIDLDRLNWGNYDLVVIDESHNFRNGGKIVENPDENDKENRYVKLLKKVIRAGVKTKVLMLSATPVNNRFNDLKNQLALAYEGHTEYIDDKLNTTRSIDDIFKNAQRAFNTWSKWEPCDRTTENLLKMLDFDFFEVLDSVTIARSRKHIQKYYDTSDIGTFPTRLKPISLRPHLTDLKSAITYNQIFEQRRKQDSFLWG